MPEVSDPVCGRTFAWEDARGILRHQGRLYYFCCELCRSRFSNRPDAFLNDEHPAPAEENRNPAHG